MLDDKDKQYIKEIIESRSLKGTSKEIASIESINKHLKNLYAKEIKRAKEQKELTEAITLLKKRYNKKDFTLSEEIQLRKLQIKQAVDNAIPKSIQDFAKGASNLGVQGAKGVLSSRASNDALKTLMYSNPITAAIYQNKDLFGAIANFGLGTAKGIGNIGGFLGNKIYQYARRNRQFEETTSQGTSLIPAMQQKALGNGGTNYIAAKNAMFVGGKNYILMGATPMSFKNGLSGTFQSKMVQQETPLLANPRKNEIEIQATSIKTLSKGIEGIKKESSIANTFLKGLLNKQTLIVGGIVLGVAALIGLGVWLKNKFGGAKNVIGTPSGINKLKDEKKQLEDANDFMIKDDGYFMNTNYDYVNKLAQNKDKLGGVTSQSEIAKTDKNKLNEYDRVSMRDNSNIEHQIFETEKLTPVLSPFDGIVNSRDYSRDNGYYTLVLAPKIGNNYDYTKRVKFKNIKNTAVTDNSKIHKGQIIGMTDGQLEIIGDISGTMSGYSEMMKQAKQDSYKQAITDTFKYGTDEGIKQTQDYYFTMEDRNKEEEKIQKDLNKVLNQTVGTPLYTEDYTPSTNISDVNLGNKNVEALKDTINKQNQQTQQTPKQTEEATPKMEPVIIPIPNQSKSLSFQPDTSEQLYAINGIISPKIG